MHIFGGLLLAPVLIVHILMYAWWEHSDIDRTSMLGGLLLAPGLFSNSAHIGRTSDVCLVGYYLPLFLIVHILVEHLMYAWWVITCPCSNSAHIGRTSDVCYWWVITCPCSNSHILAEHILVEHLMYAWWVITCPCSNSANSAHIGRTSDVCLVGYYLPLF